MEFEFESVLFLPFCGESHADVNKSWWVGGRTGKVFIEVLERSLTEESEWVCRVGGRNFQGQGSQERQTKWNAHGRTGGKWGLRGGQGPQLPDLSCGETCRSLAWVLAGDLLPGWGLPRQQSERSKGWIKALPLAEEKAKLSCSFSHWMRALRVGPELATRLSFGKQVGTGMQEGQD